MPSQYPVAGYRGGVAIIGDLAVGFQYGPSPPATRFGSPQRSPSFGPSGWATSPHRFGPPVPMGRFNEHSLPKAPMRFGPLPAMAKNFGSIPKAVLRKHPGWRIAEKLAELALQEALNRWRGDSPAQGGFDIPAGWETCFICPSTVPTHYANAFATASTCTPNLSCVDGQAVSSATAGTAPNFSTLRHIHYVRHTSGVAPNMRYKFVAQFRRPTVADGTEPVWNPLKIPAVKPIWATAPALPRPLPFGLLPYRAPNPHRDVGPRADPKPLGRLAPGAFVPFARPGPRVKEKKLILGIPAGALKSVLNAATETKDFANSFYEALPAEAKCGKCAFKNKMRALYNNWDKVDFGKALSNVIQNEAEDRFFGKLGRIGARENRRNNLRIGLGPAL